MTSFMYRLASDVDDGIEMTSPGMTGPYVCNGHRAIVAFFYVLAARLHRLHFLQGGGCLPAIVVISENIYIYIKLYITTLVDFINSTSNFTLLEFSYIDSRPVSKRKGTPIPT